ncbi:MAG: BBP7 family outer membrane beta-barrel protein [Pirellulales bacterium]
MTHPFKSFVATIGMLMLALVGGASAQENLPFGPSNYEHDLQIFAPFDLDLDNMSDDQWSGYFFEYNKLYWSYTGERVTVGNEEVGDVLTYTDLNGQMVTLATERGQFAEIIYLATVDSNTISDRMNLPRPHVIKNTLHDVPPKAGFALGDRYEFGYQDQGHGWTVGILDGPELNQTEFYGFPRDLATGGGLPPFIDPDYTGPEDIGPGGGITASPGLRAFGFGSVPIIFEVPEDYLLGFRDYLNFLAGALLGTQGGPMLWVGNYGLVDEADIDDDTIPFFRLADDLDADENPGADPLTGGTDFDDLHEFNIFFNNVTIHNRTEIDGIELMWTHQLTNQHYMAKHKNNRVSISGGARFLKLEDQFRVDADGSILGRSFWDTLFVNQIVGPQVGLHWVNQRQRWRLSGDGRFMFGYNVADWDQFGLMGEELIPGALNRPLYARPTAFAHGLREQEFSPVAELRVQTSYHVTSSLALKLGLTSKYVGNIHRAAPSVFYRLPDMGYRDAGNQDILINGVDFGVEFVH